MGDDRGSNTCTLILLNEHYIVGVSVQRCEFATSSERIKNVKNLPSPLLLASVLQVHQTYLSDTMNVLSNGKFKSKFHDLKIYKHRKNLNLIINIFDISEHKRNITKFCSKFTQNFYVTLYPTKG